MEEIIRSRLVARDFKKRGEADRFELFAVTPPLEAKRMLFRMAALKNQEHASKKYKLTFLDVKKAHLSGKLKEDERAYVVLPPQARSRVARLQRWLRGMRPAAKAWQEDYAENLCFRVCLGPGGAYGFPRTGRRREPGGARR